MTKIFISQPMNGKTTEEIAKERNYIIERLKENESVEHID